MQYQNIVLIDDDQDDRDIFLTVLKSLTSTVQCVAFDDATMALQKLETKEIIPDVIFLDLNMPAMDGGVFLAEVKQQIDLKKIPIIILTTCSQTRSIEEMKQLGAQDFFIKPNKYLNLII